METRTYSTPARRGWANDLARLQSMAAAGVDTFLIAIAFDRTRASVQTHMSRLGIADHNLPLAVRERIIQLAGKSYTVTRIGRQLGLSDTLVRRVLAKSGVVPSAGPRYPNAGMRYGRDLPMPVATLPVSESA